MKNINNTSLSEWIEILKSLDNNILTSRPKLIEFLDELRVKYYDKGFSPEQTLILLDKTIFDGD